MSAPASAATAASAFAAQDPVSVLTSRICSLEGFSSWTKSVELYARLARFVGTEYDDHTINVAWKPTSSSFSKHT